MLSPTKQNTNFKILIVDSSDNYLNLYTEYLQSISEKKYQIVTAHNWQDASQLWRSQEFDLAIIEIDLPDGNGLELLAEIAKNTELTKLPIIITNQEADQELTITAMQRGASDFFVKNNITQVALCRSVDNVIEQGILAKRVLRLQQREEIINKISASVYQFLSLTKIYQLITQELQIFLEADRILIYKFQPGELGDFVAETVIEPWSSCLQVNMIDQCFVQNWQQNLQLARVCPVSDVNTANLNDCYRQFLQSINVQANLVVPIMLPNSLTEQNEQPVLWGVIIAHQCTGPRIWDEHDINLLERLSVNLAIALQQAELYENLQDLNKSLENKVRERTVELEQMIDQYQQVEVALSQLNQELETRVADRTQDLQDSENRLLDAQEFARMGTWQVDVVNSQYTYSKEVLNVFRINPVQGKTSYDQINSRLIPSHRQIREKLLEKLLEDGQEFSMDFQIIRDDGTTGYVLSKARPDFDENGKVIGIFGIVMDITERKEAEEKLRKSEQLFATLAQVAPVAIFRMNANGECIYVNDFWVKMTGQPVAQALQAGWLNAIHPDDQEKMWVRWQKAIEERDFFQIEGKVIKPGNQTGWFYCQAVPEFDDYDQIIGYVGTFTDITDSKNNEKVLRNLSTRLGLAIKSANMGIWEFDLRNDQAIWDSRMYELYGITPEQLDLKNQARDKIINLIHPDDQIIVTELMLNSNEHPISFDIEYRTIWPDSSIHTLKAYGILFFDSQQQPLSIIGVNYDITEKQLAEAEILRSRDLWEIVFNQSTDALFLVDHETLITIDCNLRAVEIFEANSKGDLINQCSNLLQKKQFTSAEIDNIQFEMSTKGFWTTELEYITLQGNLFWGSFASKEIMVAGQLMNLVRVTDISERKRVERELIDSQSFIQTLINTIPLPLFWKDRNSQFLGCNYQFLKIIGLSDISELLGKSNLDVVCLRAKAKKFIEDDQKVITTGESLLGIEETITLQNGEKLWLETNKAPIRDSDNQIIGLVGTIQDITERKLAADHLRETNTQLAKATRMKDEFLANMSHELRTPLNAILGMSEVLLEQMLGEINPRQEKAIKLIERSGKHLLDLINDILDLSKIEAGKFKLDFNVVSVTNLCSNSIALVEQMANQKNVSLSNHIVTNIKNIWVDERRIQQVLLNLLSNAIKFTPAGGQVSLVVSEDNYEILFSVIDSGIGIAENDIDIVFQPFMQIDSSLSRQYTGTGLGLALVKKIVDQHQGSITVTSKIDQGSCFTVRLPYYPLSLVNDDQQEIKQPTIMTNSPVTQERSPLILIADDNKGNLQTTEDYLVNKGYRVILATDGEEAINLMRLNQPDIILMDIQMPKMDGLQAIQIIRSDPNFNNIPIIVISALTLKTDVEKCLQAGANEYFIKPMRLKKLLESIEKLMSE